MGKVRLRTIFGARLARKLIKKGFVVRDIKPNSEDKKRTIFLFDDTLEIRKIVDDFSDRR